MCYNYCARIIFLLRNIHFDHELCYNNYNIKLKKNPLLFQVIHRV